MVVVRFEAVHVKQVNPHQRLKQPRNQTIFKTFTLLHLYAVKSSCEQWTWQKMCQLRMLLAKYTPYVASLTTNKKWKTFYKSTLLLNPVKDGVWPNPILRQSNSEFNFHFCQISFLICQNVCTAGRLSRNAADACMSGSTEDSTLSNIEAASPTHWASPALMMNEEQQVLQSFPQWHFYAKHGFLLAWWNFNVT